MWFSDESRKLEYVTDFQLINSLEKLLTFKIRYEDHDK